MAGREITDPSEAVKRVDYRAWFSDSVVNGYLASFSKRYARAKGEGEKKEISDEANRCVLNYALLVYHLYEKSPNFKKSIVSDGELKRNFIAIKKWLDTTGAKKGADDYVDEMIAAALAAK